MDRALRTLVVAVPCVAIGWAVVAFWPGSGPVTTPGGFEVPREYGFLYDWDDASEAELRGGLPIDRIALVRTTCLGECPAYEVRLNRTGHAEYDGHFYIEREGEWQGEVPLWDFALLGLAVERIGFESLADSYSVEWTDQPSATVSVEWTDGITKSVYSYGEQAPPEFWLLTEAIDAATARIEWQPVAR